LNCHVNQTHAFVLKLELQKIRKSLSILKSKEVTETAASRQPPAQRTERSGKGFRKKNTWTRKNKGFPWPSDGAMLEAKSEIKER